jgi:hypothetical protein
MGLDKKKKQKQKQNLDVRFFLLGHILSHIGVHNTIHTPYLGFYFRLSHLTYGANYFTNPTRNHEKLNNIKKNL